MSTTKQVSLHGRRAYLSPEDILVGKGAVGTGGAQGPSTILPGGAEITAVFEDFYDTGGPRSGLTTIAGDTGVSSAHVAGPNGVHRITGTTQVAGPTVVIGESLDWTVNQGPGSYAGRLHMGARIKKSTYTGGEHGVFVGFTDVVGAEMPFHDTGGTADKATASNGFGIMWNLSGDTGWVGVAVDGDTYQEAVLDQTAPTDDTWVTLEMVATRGQSDTGGTVKFFVDGVPQGYINNPCNVSTALVPTVAVYDTGGAANVDIDWVNVSAHRD